MMVCCAIADPRPRAGFAGAVGVQDSRVCAGDAPRPAGAGRIEDDGRCYEIWLCGKALEDTAWHWTVPQP